MTNALIDYPPGGLGNFVAQILTNTVNLDLHHLAYHSDSDKKYDDSLISRTREEFLSKFENWKLTSNVTIIHSFGTLNEIDFSGRVYQVVVEDDMISYMLTQQIKTKAIDSDHLKEFIQQNYGVVSDSTVRENYAYQYQYLRSTKTFVNTVSNRTDFAICFDNFYKDKESFVHEVKKINSKIDANRLYEHFVMTQSPIIEKKNLYLRILDCIKKNISFELIDLSVIDQGIISGLLNEIYPFKEWQLPDREKWFSNTEEIYSIINAVLLSGCSGVGGRSFD